MESIYFLSLNPIQFAPYAYGLLRSYIEQDKILASRYAWQEPICKLETVDEIIEKITDPDVLCASCYVWNHNQQLQIAKKVKAKYPDCKVICGGPHVPDSSDSYFSNHPYIDVLVHGEGERPLKNLLLEFIKDVPDLGRIPNISFNSNTQAVKTPNGPGLPKNLPLPSPYLNGHLSKFIKEGRQNLIGLWETNRGCPYSCSFCDWGVRTMNKLRLHDLDKIKAEIGYFAGNKIEDIYITDCNFGILERDLEIARMLSESKEKYGFPKRVRIQFAKKSNDTVFNISKILHEKDMLWGTTLSMQSLDMDVLKAINRPHIGINDYRKLKDRYKKQGIPTYTELILGLPLETRESFIDGICSLFEIGIHDDIRVFELTILPNAPIGYKAARKKYGLKTKFKPLRIKEKNSASEEVELVFATSTMPHADWSYCFLFSEAIQALHNGGYTRFLARYLNDESLMSYKTFYDQLLHYMLRSGLDCFKSIKRIQKLIDDFYQDPDMPQIHRLLTQPDIMAFLNSYNPGRKGWQPWTYIWLSISEKIGAFYQELLAFLNQQGLWPDEKILDLIQYQQEIMITLDYNPKRGKTVRCKFNWFGYFFENEKLRKKSTTLHYADIHMGTSHRYQLAKNNKKNFLNAAIGISYPYSKFRHFFHQPDMTKKL
jgi:putative methyltransferase